MRRALYKADTNGNLLLKFKSYSSYIPHSPAPFPQLEGDAAPGRQRGPQNSSQPAACHAAMHIQRGSPKASRSLHHASADASA